MQRQHQGAASVQRRLGATDFRHPRQEGENVAVVLGQRASDGFGDRVGQVADMRDVAGLMLNRDRILTAGALDDVSIHQAGQPGTVGGGGHRQQPQVRAQLALQIEAQRQAEIRFQRAFMDFVQDHGGHAVQPGVGLQAPKQQALGDDLDAGFRRTGAVQPGPVADDTAHRLADQRRHPGCRRSGCQPPRFQHQDAAVAAPRGIQQCQRHEGGLAGTRRRDEHGVAAGAEGGVQGGKSFGDGKGLGHGWGS